MQLKGSDATKLLHPLLGGFLCHQWDIGCPQMCQPPRPSRPPETHTQAEEEHLEALFYFNLYNSKNHNIKSGNVAKETTVVQPRAGGRQRQNRTGLNPPKAGGGSPGPTASCCPSPDPGPALAPSPPQPPPQEPVPAQTNPMTQNTEYTTSGERSPHCSLPKAASNTLQRGNRGRAGVTPAAGAKSRAQSPGSCAPSPRPPPPCPLAVISLLRRYSLYLHRGVTEAAGDADAGVGRAQGAQDGGLVSDVAPDTSGTRCEPVGRSRGDGAASHPDRGLFG